MATTIETTTPTTEVVETETVVMTDAEVLTSIAWKLVAAARKVEKTEDPAKRAALRKTLVTERDALCVQIQKVFATGKFAPKAEKEAA